MSILRKVDSNICSRTAGSKFRSTVSSTFLLGGLLIISISPGSAADGAASKKVDPVPKGMHTITPSLQLKNAHGAIDYYKRAFGAEQLEIFTTPDGKKVVHAELKIGDSRLMINDDFSSKEHPDQVQATLHLCVPDVDKSFEQAISAGAKIEMPVANMFWGDRYGELIDPFGQRWSLSTHIEDVPTEEISKRALDYFKNLKKTTDESIKQADTPK